MKTRVLILFLLMINGCAIKDVKSWEKSKLSKDSMSEAGINNNFKAFKEHIYFSKEATRVGNTIGGGGCGCN
ncbi:MAG: hypothetical protein DRG11_04410 [Epsilonproteobacteria bacterium]|nr:MAG: hypothetical protein DRG11_04410 [Campylobacterota bacterium]